MTNSAVLGGKFRSTRPHNNQQRVMLDTDRQQPCQYFKRAVGIIEWKHAGNAQAGNIPGIEINPPVAVALQLNKHFGDRNIIQHQAAIHPPANGIDIHMLQGTDIF